MSNDYDTPDSGDASYPAAGHVENDEPSSHSSPVHVAVPASSWTDAPVPAPVPAPWADEEVDDFETPPKVDPGIIAAWDSCSNYQFDFLDEQYRVQLIAYAEAIRKSNGNLYAVPRPKFARDDVLLEFATIYHTQ